MKYIIFLLFFIIFTASFTPAQTSWQVDKSHSNIQFIVTHMLISKVNGQFKDFDINVSAKNGQFENAEIKFTADVKSIDTENEKRDAHLLSDDFFNAEMYPHISFISRSFKKVGHNKYKLTGDFKMRDVTRKITLDVIHGGIVRDSYGNTRTGFTISGVVNRFDYNLRWNALLETGGSIVGKDVEIKCNIELIQHKEQS